jgi:hypothetical protein
VKNTEYYLPFSEFPWFRKAAIEDIAKVKLERPMHLRWETLDVDLHIDSLTHLDQYPLISRAPKG